MARESAVEILVSMKNHSINGCVWMLPASRPAKLAAGQILVTKSATPESAAHWPKNELNLGT
jgi:hypothetical protein